MPTDYFNYFDSDENAELSRRPSRLVAITADNLREQGFGAAEIEAVLRSGYIMPPECGPTLFDRYYSGVNVIAADQRSRVSTDTIKSWLSGSQTSQSRVWLKEAWCPDEVREIVSEAQTKTEAKLVLRGQPNHYTVTREIPNQCFTHPQLGETSLLASVWRVVLKRDPMSYEDFVGPSLLEWSIILTYGYDFAHVREHGNELIKRRPVEMMTISDMCESDDPKIRRYGEFRHELAFEFWRYDIALSTLLQHYGLHSPVVDLTHDLDIALFFATNRLVLTDRPARYIPYHPGEDNPIIYIFEFDQDEMVPYFREELLGMLQPLRPERQRCAVAVSDTHSINRVAKFLVGAIWLRGENFLNRSCAYPHLFPSDKEDSFLRALKIVARKWVTEF